MIAAARRKALKKEPPTNKDLMNKALMKNSRYLPAPNISLRGRLRQAPKSHTERHTERHIGRPALALKMVGFAGLLGWKPVIPNRPALGAAVQHGGQGDH
jgi:hypothetical protein